MFKKYKEYDFREIVNHFVLMRNVNIVKNPDNIKYIDDMVEDVKEQIIKDTKNYYKENCGYDETMDDENTFSMDNLNDDMTTRKVSELYEPMYGYVCIEKNRGLIIYLLGNVEDKKKYVYAPTYWSCRNNYLEDIEMEIIDDDEYEYSDLFKEQIQYDEELDEDVIETRKLRNLDMFRLDISPDFVVCTILHKDGYHTAKVKLVKFENNIVYAKYHEQKGILTLIQQDNSSLLLFKPLEIVDEKVAFNEYIKSIIDGFEKDFGLAKPECLQRIGDSQKLIEECYKNGDLPFEAIIKIDNMR